MKHLRNILFGGEQASRGELLAHGVYLALALTALGVGLGLVALILGACAYAPLWHWQLFLSYFAHPPLVLLNLLPAVLLVFLGWFLFHRGWAAYLFAALPTVGFALVNYYKIQLRGDPFLAPDFRLLRTAGGIISHYSLTLTHIVLLAAGLCLAMLLFSVFLVKNGARGRHLRPVGALACAALAFALYTQVYLDDGLYEKTANNELINRWSDVEVFVSRGFWYPFLRTMPDLLPTPPEGYSAASASAALAQYADADIPADRRVNVVGVMLEAFSDLTDFPALADHESVRALYEPLHALEEQSVSGDLLTNIFAGGTVDSEWGFLTGYTQHDEFRADTDSYVRYFAAQGYDTVYQHPGYSWFYNRSNVNRYLGFGESVFTENGFGALVDPKLAPFRSDEVLFSYLLRSLDEREEGAPPLFSFSVSYQNHGPYSADSQAELLLTPEETGWSRESCSILSVYLRGVSDTIRNLLSFTQSVEGLDKPVVLVVYGDHKPWLGNDNSVYQELGVDLDVSQREGFCNYYSTPYLIWANRAAKEALGADFTGDGGDFSPCFLMPKLFDLCSWEGPGFMAYARALRQITPLVHERGLYLRDGELTDTLGPDAEAFYRTFLCAQYYRETRGLR